MMLWGKAEPVLTLGQVRQPAAEARKALKGIITAAGPARSWLSSLGNRKERSLRTGPWFSLRMPPGRHTP